MSRRTAMVIGGTGMLGHKLAQVLTEAEELDVHVAVRSLPPSAYRAPKATYHEGIEIAADRPQLASLLSSVRPDIVVNAAGAIKHRELSSDTAGTLFLNGTLPHALAALNPNTSARVIHFSTDCVFKGDRGSYREKEQPDATDLYGLSKATGELRYSPHLTIRTSIVGFEFANHLGLLSWLLKQPAGRPVKGFRRAIFSGLPTATLSHTVLDIIRRFPDLTGLYHVASEPINKLDLLQRVSAALDLQHEFVPSDELVIDRSLDDTRFRSATGTQRPAWDALVADLSADYHSLPYGKS